jgi:hypothetical protein
MLDSAVVLAAEDYTDTFSAPYYWHYIRDNDPSRPYPLTMLDYTIPTTIHYTARGIVPFSTPITSRSGVLSVN